MNVYTSFSFHPMEEQQACIIMAVYNATTVIYRIELLWNSLSSNIIQAI